MDQKKFILIVEDEAGTGHLLESVLAAKGHDVCLVSNGVKALAKIKDRVPDLIISDVIMPEMDGYVFYKELKKNPSVAGVPVIILTAHGKMEDTFAVLGVDEFLIKPFETETLLAKVNTLLARDKASAEAVTPEGITKLESAKKSFPKGPVIAGGFVLLFLGLCFILVKQFAGARDKAAVVRQKMHENEKSSVMSKDSLNLEDEE